MPINECIKMFKENDTYEIGFITGIKAYDKTTHKEVNYGKTIRNNTSQKANIKR